MEPGRHRAAKTGASRVRVDGFEVVLAFPVKPRADAPHFVRPGRVDGLARFLVMMHAETAEESRQPYDPTAGLDEPCEQVPVERELKRGIDAANPIPSAFAPEERF